MSGAPGAEQSVATRADIMDYLAPLGPVFQTGTCSGNSLALATGISNREELTAINVAAEVSPRTSQTAQAAPTHLGGYYAKLEKLGAQLEAGMKDAAKTAGVPVTFNRCGSMFCGYFTSSPVWNVADAMKADRERFKKFFHGLLDAGVYLAPSQFEAGFMSTAHSEADIQKTVDAVAQVLKTL